MFVHTGFRAVGFKVDVSEWLGSGLRAFWALRVVGGFLRVCRGYRVFRACRVYRVDRVERVYKLRYRPSKPQALNLRNPLPHTSSKPP